MQKKNTALIIYMIIYIFLSVQLSDIMKYHHAVHFFKYSIFIIFFEQEIRYLHIWDLIHSFQEKMAF